MIFVKNLFRNKTVLLAIVLYLLTAFVAFDKFVSALNGSLYYFKEMILIMPVVFMMTVLIEVWIPKEMISKNLGDQSGVKGVLLALILGSVSAGPIYAAFPITKTLLKKGAGIMNIVIILSAWAVIKVPMLANEAKFLGAKFMVIRWVLTVFVIVMMGYAASLLVKPSQLPLEEDVIDQPAVDEQACIGCQICIPHGQGILYMKGKKACVDLIKLTELSGENLIKASKACPVAAIKLPLA